MNRNDFCRDREISETDRSRRAFLASVATAMGAVSLAPGIFLMSVGHEVAAAGEGVRRASASVRWGLLIDATRCRADCDACVLACHQENGLPLPQSSADVRWIRKVTLRDPKSGAERSFPAMCMHCAHPPCVDVCPTGASFKRADGIVLVNRHTCIGCRYCVMACPYKARNFVHAPVTTQKPDVPRGMGCAEGCTLCVHRVDRGEKPACVEACPTGALLFGDLNDPQSAIAQRVRELNARPLRSDLKLDPGVRFFGV